MAVQHLIKGETDWHTKMNTNMDSLQTDIDEAKSDAADAVATKLDKPTNQTLTEGYVYKTFWLKEAVGLVSLSIP